MIKVDVLALKQEREELFSDLYSGKIPKRVPVGAPFTIELATAYAGENLMEVSWNAQKQEAVYEKVCQDFVSDAFPVSMTDRNPLMYQLLGAKPIVMSSAGSMQHPDIVGMLPEEYDALISNPFDYLVETVLSRLYTELDTDPHYRALVMAKAIRAQADELQTSLAVRARVSAKYGYPSVGLMGGRGPMSVTLAPLDFLADFLRSFRGLSGDLRRFPDKVKLATEAVLPLVIKQGMSPIPHVPGVTFIPLHMPTFMRTKDFEKYYWPTFIQQVEALNASGQTIVLFAEDDWTRYLDYLADLPVNMRIMFEYGDPQLVKEKLGKKHYLSGFYPVSLLHSGTKQQCIDKAKEMLDALAPGGRYQFGYDKNLISTRISASLVENIQAVLEYVRENGKYEERV